MRKYVLYSWALEASFERLGVRVYQIFIQNKVGVCVKVIDPYLNSISHKTGI